MTIARFEVRWQHGVWMAMLGGFLFWGTFGALVILVLTNGFLTWYVSRSIIKPLGLLENAARKVGQGDLTPSVLPREGDEFGSVADVFDEMRIRLKDSLEAQSALEEDRRTWVASVSHDIRRQSRAQRSAPCGKRKRSRRNAVCRRTQYPYCFQG